MVVGGSPRLYTVDCLSCEATSGLLAVASLSSSNLNRPLSCVCIGDSRSQRGLSWRELPPTVGCASAVVACSLEVVWLAVSIGDEFIRQQYRNTQKDPWVERPSPAQREQFLQ